jgi:4'-phosphopantetheinyl transferase EntD
MDLFKRKRKHNHKHPHNLYIDRTVPIYLSKSNLLKTIPYWPSSIIGSFVCSEMRCLVVQYRSLTRCFGCIADSRELEEFSVLRAGR